MQRTTRRILQLGSLFLFLFVLPGLKGKDAPAKSNQKLNKKEITSSMLKALAWQEDHPIHAKAPTDWTNGAYYTGVVRAHEATGNKKYKKALQKMGERNDWQPYNRFYHADDVAICYSYLYLHSLGDTKVNLKPTKNFILDHLYKPHAWKDGSEGGDKLTLWYWCDALFMAPPVITYHSVMTNDTKDLDEMHKYYIEAYDLLFDKEENLFARDARFIWKGNGSDIKDGNGEKVFWSRGNGWVLGGLALMLEKMPANYQHRPFYEELFKKMAARVKELQPADGLWRTSLLHPDGYDHGEVSGTGFYTFALAWGINNGMLDKAAYTPSVLKAWEGLTKCQHPDGMIGWVQNIGFDPKPASVDSWQNYGTGAYLLAGSEVLKMESSKSL